MAPTQTDAGKLLGIYLNDHLAGATVGVELAKRTAGANHGTEFGAPLGQLASEIAEDRSALRRIMDRLDVRADPVKTTLAWGAEKAGRLKLNGQLRGYSPLSRVVEVEGLISGVNGKLSLWRALQVTAPAEPRLDATELASLEQRAQDQLRRLHDLRDGAVATAFTRA
jgi:hypothetical protein